MPTVHKLDGLIAWTRREDWRDAMADTLTRHTASACADAGLDIEDVPEILGSPVNGTIWGAAFEDLVAANLPDGRNIADQYLKRRGWTEPAATREYITALRHSVISLYEVSDVVPGESMLLRDLVCPAEPVTCLREIRHPQPASMGSHWHASDPAARWRCHQRHTAGL